MTGNYLGESAALLTAVCWTVTALAFEMAGKRVGALSLNLIRLMMGFILLAFFNLLFNGYLFPRATGYQWFWLLFSGFVGFVMGDLFLFRAFIVIGARISMLVMALVPPITALIGWVALGEMLSGIEFIGMGVTLSGILMVMAKRIDLKRFKAERTFKSGPLLIGILLALGGAIGQASGLVLSKKGMQDMNAFMATEIRVLAGMVGFIAVITILKRWNRVVAGIKDFLALKYMAIGSFTGPFLGVSLSLLAVQNTETGIAATLMALVPVFIIPPAILIRKERIHWMEILGAMISVAGVALFFLDS